MKTLILCQEQNNEIRSSFLENKQLMYVFVCFSDKRGRGMCVPFHPHEEAVYRLHHR